ncbi:hypothetical protein ACFOON_06975 [Novosphingobium piscinae]|uniref:Argininosuccinate lyase n=1 Tax=Novosphingobium piscinae TaxID=1507448 RepID=A0A7X1FWV4_9SPHN|nr:hypothetical protein [Novosphingobium piscinae]MBC2668466.1 hypothetical protein [Novosphingobium piscinae]
MRGTIAMLTVLAALLAGCGQTAELKPQAGRSLPVAPYGRGDQPSANTLLTLPPQAAPERSVELRSRSEQRRDDPFDLPPQG